MKDFEILIWNIFTNKKSKLDIVNNRGWRKYFVWGRKRLEIQVELLDMLLHPGGTQQ